MASIFLAGQWFYRSKDGWVPYSKEDAEATQTQFDDFRNGGGLIQRIVMGKEKHTYRLDFTNMTQTNVQYNTVREIQYRIVSV